MKKKISSMGGTCSAPGKHKKRLKMFVGKYARATAWDT